MKPFLKITLTLLMYLTTISLTAQESVDTTAVKEGNDHSGHFVLTGASYLLIYGNTYDKCGFEVLTLGYSFLKDSFNAGISLGLLGYSNGSRYSYLETGHAGTVMAYLSYGIRSQAERFSLYPTLEAGVAYGTIDFRQKQTRFAGSIGLTLMYRPLEWLRLGLDTKFMGFSNSDSSWLMLGIKVGFEF